MKVLSLNFLTCAVKACKSTSGSYPLHPKDAELVEDDLEINLDLLLNVMTRIDWTALSITATEVGCVQYMLISLIHPFYYSPGSFHILLEIYTNSKRHGTRKFLHWKNGVGSYRRCLVSLCRFDIL